LYVGTPPHSTPDQGSIEISLKMNALCHSRFDTMGKSINPSSSSAGSDWQSIESWLNRCISQSRVVDLKQLCIKEGRSAWKIQITVIVLNHDGNVWDVAWLSALVALADLTLPKVCIDETDDKVSIISSSERVALKLVDFPIPTTIGLFENKLFVDPDDFEESIMNGVMNIVMNEKGDIVSLNKIGGDGLSPEEIESCFVLAKARVADLSLAIRNLHKINDKKK